MAEITLEMQIACAKREVALRKRVYPRFVAAKRLNEFKAEEEIAVMTAVVATLESLQRKRPA